MVTYTTKESLAKALQNERSLKGKITIPTVGFVPTMGALHKGHLSLVQRALSENQIVVVSIFVNPTQFDNPTDLEKYPRNPDQDLSLLADVSEDIIVYLPQADDLYGNSVSSEHYEFDGLENEMEGKHRIGHFDGVGTVVKKFFDIINPDRAYFGEKDFQQLQIIRKLVTKKNLPVEIVGCPIMREENGLAMSSRNERLTPKQFSEASIIYKTLLEVREKFESFTITELTKMVVERFLTSPDLELEYFEIAKEDTLEPQQNKIGSTKYRAFIAVFVDNIRLIDNMPLN